MTRPDRERAVSRAFVELADTLVDEYDVIDMLDRLVAHSVELLAADAAGLLLADGRRELRVVAASTEAAQLTELLQLQAEEGPGLDCFRTGRPVSVPDLRSLAGRWPDLARAVEGGGPFRSVHALPLRLRGASIGTLNLFEARPGALPEADLALGQALADVATIGILQERAIRHGEVLSEQLQTALDSRVVIEQAKGFIAHSLGLDMATAFERLRGYCRRHNLRLSDTAARIVARELDPRHQLGTTSRRSGPPRP